MIAAALYGNIGIKVVYNNVFMELLRMYILGLPHHFQAEYSLTLCYRLPPAHRQEGQDPMGNHRSHLLDPRIHHRSRGTPTR